MSFKVEFSNHPQRKRFLIKMGRIRAYAANSKEVALAVDHYFVGDGVPPEHHNGRGMPDCPLCKEE